MAKEMKRVLVTGALGQIGSELTAALRKTHGGGNVVASDFGKEPDATFRNAGPFETIDVLDTDALKTAVKKHKIDTIYHLAAILSAAGEKNPHRCWDVNMNGTYNILELAREYRIVRVFVPSSIAAFGPRTQRVDTPQCACLDPRTMYGVTKVAGEYLGDYYVARFGVDVRGCRFPGIISYQTLPGGGTTDYAVAIYYEAVKNKRYTCFLKEDTRLPMMYMPDCLKSIQDLMEADFSRLRQHSNFNVTAMSFTPGEIAAEIRKHIPEFVCEYKPDFRQAIADSWPASIDDSAAREEWGWKPDYDLGSMTGDMLRVLGERHAEGALNY
jgi:nucleoside-diphosphate-sugar epimerase